MAIKIAVIGITGRVGSRVAAMAAGDPDFTLVGGCSSSLSSVDAVLPLADVAIDFSLAHATIANLDAAIRHCKPLVIGTTGLTEAARNAMAAAAKHVAVLYAPNFSLGIALCMKSALKWIKYFEGEVEIIETHHLHKKDRPSGTALALAAAMERDASIIQSIRAEGAVAEHKIIFKHGAERIELTHATLSRDTFASGALKAAKFLVRQPPGLYTLHDVFPIE